jgi:hypothetical protein
VATISNLFIDQGSDYSNIITVTGSNGQPINLTGFTVKSQIRKSFGSTIAYEFTPTIFAPATGKIRMQLSSESSEEIVPGRYLYDVEITSPSGIKTRVVEGIVTVTPQITRI